MKDLLLLTQRMPFPPIKGEKIRQFRILQHLRQKFRVHLGCLIDDPDDRQYIDELRALCTDSFVGLMDNPAAKLGYVRGLLQGDPLSFAYFWRRDLARWVDKVLNEVRPEVAVVCSSNMAPYVLDHPLRPGRLIIDYTDVDSDKFRAYAATMRGPKRWLYQREARLVLERDRAAARLADYGAFVTEPETALFQRLAPESAAKMRAIGNGVDAEYFTPETAYAPLFDPGIPHFVFTGTMDYWPNIDAVTWFADAIFPRICARISNARFMIAGANPSADVMRLGNRPGIHVTGRVADVRPYIAHGAASVAPIRIARGIQNKVLEAMAMARPVITASPAFEGITATPGKELIVADDPEDFADMACKVALGEIDGHAIGRSARQCVVAHYSWAAQMSKFDALVES
ncbi:MAG: TIGR03087 family PEP-CTERM/XrtA system glycosyltransferase [Alphaproteobacteria bacterium]